MSALAFLKTSTQQLLLSIFIIDTLGSSPIRNLIKKLFPNVSHQGSFNNEIIRTVEKKIKDDALVDLTDLRFLDYNIFHLAEIESTQLVTFSIDYVQSRFWSKFHFDQTTMVGVQPLAYNHFVNAYTPVGFLIDCFLKNFQTSSTTILQFHQTVSNSSAKYWHEREDYANVNVDELATLN